MNISQEKYNEQNGCPFYPSTIFPDECGYYYGISEIGVMALVYFNGEEWEMVVTPNAHYYPLGSFRWLKK